MSQPTLHQNMHRAVEAGLWFDDGNIILVAEKAPFKVHRSLLSQRSEVLKDILSIPQPPVPDKSEVMDGVPIIRVSDTWKELSYVLCALYNGYKLFGDLKPLSFPVISAFLRLGRKYSISELEQSAVYRLEVCFPDTDECLEHFKNVYTTCPPEDDDYLYFDPPLIHMRIDEVPGVINLARAFDLPSLLPAAFYLSSLVHTETLINGSEDEDGNKILLSKSDLTTCINGRFYLMQHEIIGVLGMREKVSSLCRVSADSCDISSLFQSDTGGSLMIESAGAGLQSDSWLSLYLRKVCPECEKGMRAEWNLYRHKTWSKLPLIFDLDET